MNKAKRNGKGVKILIFEALITSARILIVYDVSLS